METLRTLRKKMNLRQLDVAKALGIRNTTYSMYETGQSEPSLDMLTKLADFFDVSMDELFGRKSNNDTQAPVHGIVRMYEALTDNNKLLAIGYINGLLQSQGMEVAEIKALSAEIVYNY